MIIDTNVYSALDKGSKAAVDILKSQTHLYVPVNVVAELRYGFMNGSKTKVNNTKLDKFLSQTFVDVLYPTLKTTNHYAELALFAKQAGRALSHNDLWIAALAKENESKLVTYDRDFLVFKGTLGNKLTILAD